jgi:hypothetical protein
MLTPYQAQPETNALQQFDYTLILDRSQSMRNIDENHDLTRWQRVEEGTFAIAAKVSRLCQDTLNVYTFDTDVRLHRDLDAEGVRQIIQANQPTNGLTNLGEVLKQACLEHWTAKTRRDTEGKKGEVMIIVTDGAPYLRRDWWPRIHCLREYYQGKAEARARRHIRKASEARVSEGELKLLFLQIGDCPEASRFLKQIASEFPDFVHHRQFEDLEEQGFKKLVKQVIEDKQQVIQ